jgi:hypothetical protein
MSLFESKFSSPQYQAKIVNLNFSLFAQSVSKLILFDEM